MSLKNTVEIQPLAYKVKDAAAAIGLGRSTLYEMMKDGTLRFVKVGNRRLIPADALMAVLGRQDCPA